MTDSGLIDWGTSYNAESLPVAAAEVNAAFIATHPRLTIRTVTMAVAGIGILVDTLTDGYPISGDGLAYWRD